MGARIIMNGALLKICNTTPRAGRVIPGKSQVKEVLNGYKGNSNGKQFYQ